MTDVYLSLGTNLGEREANLKKAIELLDERMEGPREALSSFISTPSWGFDSADFLNCAVRYRTALSPEAILQIVKGIEREMGRTEVLQYKPSGERIYHDRIIDIDILLYGSERIQTPSLTIPHPLMKEREFVMRPLSEIYAEKSLPL